MKRIIFSACFFTFFLFTGIVNAQHLVLVEEFTNASCFPCAFSNPGFENILNANTGKVVAIKYHASFPGYDPMYSHNSGENQSRIIYYQVTSTPQARFEGTGFFVSDVTQTAIDNAYALSSPVNINASYRISSKSDSIYASVTVKANSTVSGSLVAQIVVVEKIIQYSTSPGSNGEKTFTNVMKKMLPNNGGTALPSTMNAGDSVVINVSWALANVYYADQLAVVGFIQNNNTKAVLGTAYASSPTGTVVVVAPTITQNSKTNTSLCSNNGVIDINVSGGTTPYQYKWTNGATTQDVAGLAAGNHTVTVTGGGASAVSTFTITQQPLSKPTSLFVSDIASCSAKLSWVTVTGASYYEAAYRTVGASEWSAPVNVGTNLNYNFTELVPYTEYEFGVSSHCANGNTASYSIATGRTNICETAFNPIAEVTGKSATISWLEACYSEFYWICYREKGTSTWVNLHTGKSGIRIKSLSPGTIYEYKVKTRCGIVPNHSLWTTVSTFTTPSSHRMEDDNANTDLTENALTLFPNPSNGILNIKANFPENINSANIEVRNILGQIVYQKQAIADEGYIETTVQMQQGSPNGIYTLSIISGSVRQESRFIISY